MFRLQVVHPNGEAVLFRAGGTVETDLRDMILKAFVSRATDAILKKGVGFFRGEKHVKRDIEAGLKEIGDEALLDAFETFKAKVTPATVRIPPPSEED